VKFGVLQRAVINDNYNIRGSDIFRACLFINDTGEDFNASLINWLKTNCSNPIQEEQINLLLTKVANSYNEYCDYELEYIIGKSILDLEKDFWIDPGVGTSYFGGFFVERVHAAYDYLKGKIIRKYIPSQILAISLLLSALLNSNQFVLTQDISVNGINPRMLFAELQYIEKNDRIFLSHETTQLLNNVKEPLINELQYIKVDESSLLQFLSRKGSLLGVEPYFSSIIQASHEYDVNPLLLFAIVGQEQSYVPKNDRNARLIANNPFNVYGSWQVYNTDILDSSRIAANLVATLSKTRPVSIDPIVWINTKYAEDKKWHVGVRMIFEELNKEVN